MSQFLLGLQVKYNLFMLDVSVIIVSFNTKELTIKSVRSVLGEGSDLSKEIIVVDNASDDGSLEALSRMKDEYKKSKIGIKIIKNRKNLGFAKANNQGIKVAKGEYIFLLNSDALLKKGSLSKLVSFAKERPDAGAVGPRLLNPDGTTQASAFRFPGIFRAIRQYWLGEKGLLDKYIPETKNQEATKVESLVMAAFLITPKALKEVGLLNERYFMYFEDLDYCKRIRKKGLSVYYLPTAEVIHYHGASGKRLSNQDNQWRRLIPSSKIYHGMFKHYLINFIIWSGQKCQRVFH